MFLSMTSQILSVYEHLTTPKCYFNINTSTEVQTHICNCLLGIFTGYGIASYAQHVYSQIYQSPFSP